MDTHVCIHVLSYGTMKDAAIRIRVERELRAAFLDACRVTDRQASEVLREFMQTYAERYGSGQGDLFLRNNQSKKRLKEEALDEHDVRSSSEGRQGQRRPPLTLPNHNPTVEE